MNPNTCPPSLEQLKQLLSRRCSASRLSLNCRGQGQPSGLPSGQGSECIPQPQVGSPACPFDLRCVELFSDWWEDSDNVLITPPLMDSFTGNDWVDGVHHGGQCHGGNIFVHYYVSSFSITFFPCSGWVSMWLIFQSDNWKRIKVVFPIQQEMSRGVLQVLFKKTFGLKLD